ncbi:MAG: hypothetical protein E6G89_12045 [Alphaproteobacteria bacterium]|nr:MAG: hypothetical protein E6G89_12045 [Alphaproteobacteria bacterium]
MGSLRKYAQPQKVRDLEQLVQQKRRQRNRSMPGWWLVGLGLVIGIVVGEFWIGDWHVTDVEEAVANITGL